MDQRRKVDRANETEMSWSIPPELIRDQIREILASPMFDASERNKRFLKYIVDETLANRSDRIKGYNIGVSVFGREEDFDPQGDPVVRVEAGRLRRSLERYYLTDGCRAAIRISIPKGGYAVSFSWAPRAPATLPRASLARKSSEQTHSIFLMTFIPIWTDREAAFFCAALNEEVALELGRHDEFDVFRPPAMALDARSTWWEILRAAPADLVFTGSVRMLKHGLRTVAHLVDRAEARQLWSASFNCDPGAPTIEPVEIDLSRKIVAAMSESFFIVLP